MQGDGLPFAMELPTYRWPTLRVWSSQVLESAGMFLRRAGTIILTASLVLWVLLTFPKVEAPAGLDDTAAAAWSLEHSTAGRLGHAIEPALAPRITRDQRGFLKGRSMLANVVDRMCQMQVHVVVVTLLHVVKLPWPHLSCAS